MPSRRETFTLRLDDKDFPTVFDMFFRLVPSSTLVASLFLGLAVYLVGLSVASSIGFQAIYLETLLFRHLAFAIFLAFASVGYFKKEIVEAFVIIRPCFEVEDEAYAAHVRKWMGTVFDRRGILATWITLALLVLIGTVLVFYSPTFTQTVSRLLAQIPFREILAPEWFDEPKLLKIALLDSVVIFAAIPFSAGIWGAMHFPSLMLELASLPPMPIPSVLAVLLRKPTDLFLRVGSIWSVLTASSGLTLFGQLDIYALAVVLLIGSVGIMAFFLPQFAFHQLLGESYAKLTHLITHRYEYLRHLVEDPASSDELVEYCSGVAGSVGPVSLWVYNLNDVLLLLIGQSLSVAGTIWQTINA